MADNLKAFQKVQMEFAAHIRDPDSHNKPGDVQEERMAVYRDMFFNSADSTMSRVFPVLRSLYDDDAWYKLLRNYYANHTSTTPYFREIPQEFLAFLQEEYEPNDADPPFLIELAHYEWVEAALYVANDPFLPEGADPNGNILNAPPIVSSLAWVLSYQFPVHQIREEFQPQEPGEQPTFLVVYRDHNNRIGFMELNAVTARLIQLCQENTQQTGHELLLQLAHEIQAPDENAIVSFGTDLFNELRKRDVIIGTRAIN